MQTDLDRETLRLFGVSVEDENERGDEVNLLEEERLAGISEKDIQEEEFFSAHEETSTLKEEPMRPWGVENNGDPDTMSIEKEAAPTSTGTKQYTPRNSATIGEQKDDEWWRDPFRLFELESAVQSSPEKELAEAQEIKTTQATEDEVMSTATLEPPTLSDEVTRLEELAEKDNSIDAVDSNTHLEKDANVETNETIEIQEITAQSSQQPLKALAEEKPRNPAESRPSSDTSSIGSVPSSSKSEVTPTSRSLTFPVLFPFALSKLQSVTNVPVTKYVFYVAAAQVVWSWVQHVPAIRRVARMASPKSSSVPSKRMKEVDEEKTGREGTDVQAGRASLRDDDVDEDEIKALERLGFRRRTYSNKELEAMEEEYQEEEAAADTEIDELKVLSTTAKRQPVTNTNTWQRGIFQWLLKGEEGKGKTTLSMRDLEEELDMWKSRVQSAESEVESVQHDWSECVQQLEEAKAQCMRLQSTNRYLKEQLRDNQREMEETLKRERQRATDELARIRGAMVEVLDRERKLMRDHMMSASKEVRAAILMAEDENYLPISTEDED